MIALLAAAALAAPFTICFEAEVDHDDTLPGGGEDDFHTPQNQLLRGVRVQYKPSGAGFFSAPFYVDHDGADAGCVQLNLNVGQSYEFKILSQASVRGHAIDVVQSFTGLPFEVTTTRTFFGSGQRTIVAPNSPNRVWNVLTASSFALHRRNGGLTNYDVTFHLTNGAGQLNSPSCGGQSCVVGNQIYLKDNLANRKFAVAYAMGRTFLHHLGLVDTQYDTTLDNAHCGAATQALALHSLEHDSAAAVEGYAWFYAATVFNQTQHSDCGFRSRIAADWDMQGGVCYDEIESPADHALSCAIGPSVVPQQNQREYCRLRHIGADPPAHTSVPLDWVRFFWELQSTGQATFNSITAFYAAAIHDPAWAPTGSGARDAFTQAGLFPHAAATAHGVTP